MTPRRRWAPIVVRTFVVLGGAGILLVLGAATAGAAEAPAPAPDGVQARNRAVLPRPGSAPITVAIPLPPLPAPVGSSVPDGSLRLPGLTADLGEHGATIGTTPVSLPTPVADLPLLPADPETASVPDPAGRGASVAELDARMTSAPGARRVAIAPSVAPAVLRNPASHPPFGAPTVTLVLQLLGLAVGVDLASHRGSAPDVGVVGGMRTLRKRLRLGAVGGVVPGGAPPGFVLLLARPG